MTVIVSVINQLEKDGNICFYRFEVLNKQAKKKWVLKLRSLAKQNRFPWCLNMVQMTKK